MYKNIDYFGRKMFFRMLPVSLISYLGLALGDMADAIVIGRKMGATGLASISIALPVYMILNVITHSFGAGGSILYARFMGEGRKADAENNFHSIMRTSLFVGVCASVLGTVFLPSLVSLLGAGQPGSELYRNSLQYIRILILAFPLFIFSYVMNYYLRNDGKERLAGIAFTVANLTDVLCNILFVFIWDMGLFGAAISTVIGQMIAAAFYIRELFLKKGTLTFSFKRVDYSAVLDCFHLGFSSAVQYVFTFFFVLLANRILMRLGGDRGVAVFDMIQNVSFLILYIYEAVAKAAQPVISTFHGERNYDGRRRIFLWNVITAVSIGGICILGMVSFPEVICGIFGLTEEETIVLGVKALHGYFAGAFFAGINLLIEFYCQSCEMEKEAFTMAVMRGALFLFPSLFFFASQGIEKFWQFYFTTEVLSFVTYLYIDYRRRKGRIKEEDHVYSATISGTVHDMTGLADEIEKFCERWNATKKQIYFVRMTLEELCVAIMRHQKEGDGYIQITLISCGDGLFELHVRDNAISFNPFEMETERAGKPQCDMDAMGIFMIKNYAKEMFYRRYQGFNCLIVKI